MSSTLLKRFEKNKICIINYLHYLLQKIRNYKKGVPQTTQISKLESIFLKCPSQLEFDVNTFCGAQLVKCSS